MSKYFVRGYPLLGIEMITNKNFAKMNNPMNPWLREVALDSKNWSHSKKYDEQEFEYSTKYYWYPYDQCTCSVPIHKYPCMTMHL